VYLGSAPESDSGIVQIAAAGSNRVNVFSTAKFADRRELLEGARTERRD